MSPYLVGSTVKELVHEHGLEILVSRPEAIDDVLSYQGRQALPRTCFVLSPGAGLESREAEEQGEAQLEDLPPVQEQVELAGLHAKLFLFENGQEARLFTGSANAPDAAFQHNVEVLVELVGRKQDCGIRSFLGQEEDPGLESIRSLLVEYQAPDSIEAPDDTKHALERRVDRLARKIGAARLIATLHEADEGQSWDMTLSGKLPAISTGMEISVWPAALYADAAVRVDGSARKRQDSDGSDTTAEADVIAAFSGLSFEALTGFFAFEVCLREGQQHARQRFAVTAELIGEPENRKERVSSASCVRCWPRFA